MLLHQDKIEQRNANKEATATRHYTCNLGQTLRRELDLTHVQAEQC
jgi:hypothetical protein